MSLIQLSSNIVNLIKTQNGEDGQDGLNLATIFLYQRATSLPLVPLSNVTYTFSTGIITGDIGDWSLSMPAKNSNPCWVTTAVTISREDLDTIYSSDWKLSEKLAEDGADGTSVSITSTSHVGNTTTVNFSDGTSITIDDGTDGKGILSIVEYYKISSSDDTPPTGTWYTTLLVPDANNPYLWNYEYIIYTDTSHSETSKRIIGTYSAPGTPGADGKGIANITNYYAKTQSTTAPLIGSLDWIACPPGTIPTLDETNKYLWNYEHTVYTDNTTSDTTPHIISMFAKDGADGKDGKDGGQFSIHTNVEEILKFNTGESILNAIKYKFSADTLLINTINLLDLTFFPITQYTANVSFYGQNLKDVIKEEYYELYVYNENGDLNSYYFNFKRLYDDLYNGSLNDRINTTYSSMIATFKNFFESFYSEDIEIFALITLGENSSTNVEKFIPIKNGLSQEMVRFDINAGDITAAIQDAGLIFNSNGLTVTNSGFKIRTGNDNDGYTNVFYIDDNTKLLYMNGNGVFHGSIYAENGEFTGTVNASSGNIGGFSINNHSIVSENLELYSTYSENGITNESIIKVKNIEIGTGAEVKGRIKIGNLELLNPLENDNNVLTLISNDVNYFTITDNGNIIGNNWSIRDTANGVVADFGKIVARDGDFSGTIHATDGDFTGAINSSIINASIINTANFVTEKTRTMGGTFIFKPTFLIEKIELTETNNVLKITLNSESNTSIEDYIPDLSVINTDVIVGISGNDTRYGKITSKDGAIINVYLYDVDYSTVLTLKENYNIATLFGYGNYTDLLIGINSDDNSTVLPSRSLVMEEFTNLINNNNIGDINYLVRLLLGDLNNAPEGSGYGLYADNVFLRGSLTTAGNSSSNNSYAGINTLRSIPFKYNDWSAGRITGEEPTIYVDDNIIFWGGAEGAADGQVQISPFIVTDKGNVFARSGEFKGTVISDSLITNTIIKAPIIYGNNTNINEPSLKIYNTDSNKVGIGFYKLVGNIDEKGGETDDILTLILSNNGFAHYYNNNRRLFITFEESSNLINIDADNLNIGSTSLRQNYLQDGLSYIQINDNINGIKLANTGANILILTNEIINDATTITNKNSMIIRNGSGTEMLKYTVNNGYYCLYVEE